MQGQIQNNNRGDSRMTPITLKYKEILRMAVWRQSLKKLEKEAKELGLIK